MRERENTWAKPANATKLAIIGMGYTAHYFQYAVQLWHDRGWLKREAGIGMAV